MNSLRERIVRTVVDRLRAALHVPVLRQPTTAQPREVGPFVAVMLESDSGEVVNTALHRTLTLRITAVSRDGTDPWSQADALLCAAHRVLLSEPTLGGLALQVALQDLDFEAEDADGAAVAIPAVYAITYRHLRGDLTQGA